jgi:FKBP-type peptidyl-prolyl cis-trans isomerase 2
MIVNFGDVVKLHFVARLDNGMEIQRSHDDGPVRLVAGQPGFLPKVGEATVGLSRGDRRTIVLSPQDAFGIYRDDLRVRVPMERVPSNTKVGDHLTPASAKHKVPVKVLAVEDDAVVLDGNHPLAGKTIHIEFQVVEIDPAAGLPS